MYPDCIIDVTAAWKKSCVLSVRPDFHMTNNLSIAVHALASRALMSFSVDEILVVRYLATTFRELPFSVEMSPF